MTDTGPMDLKRPYNKNKKKPIVNSVAYSKGFVLFNSAKIQKLKSNINL